MQRGGRGRGRRGQWPGGRGNPGWQGEWGGQQDFQQQHAGGMMGPGGGGMGPPMMGPGAGMGPPGWGPDPMEVGPPGMMMGGGPGMMGPPGAGMMGPPLDAGGMQQQFGFGDAGPPMPQQQHQQQQEQQQQQQQHQQQHQQQQQQQRGRLMNVANDYCQNFVDTGLRPQNYLGETLVDDPLDMYPQQKELREAKLVQVAQHTTPAYGIRADLKRLLLSPETFGTKFDVVLIDPPWEEYVRRAPGFVKEQDREAWTWQEIKSLDIGSIADTPSFVFLWCGSEEGLDAGRHCFERWDFRRIEDICWIKTNKRRDTEPDRKYLSAQHQDPHSMLVHTKEHCLVGMRGKLMRSQHGAFVHANCDHDILFSEEPPLGSTEKPEELYNLIERFCNGRRRLELFGEDHNMRPGWVTVGKNISQTNFNRQAYVDIFRDRNGLVYVSHNNRPPADGVPVLVPTTDVIERVRPKSPPPPARPPPR